MPRQVTTPRAKPKIAERREKAEEELPGGWEAAGAPSVAAAASEVRAPFERSAYQKPTASPAATTIDPGSQTFMSVATPGERESSGPTSAPGADAAEGR